MLGAPYMDSGVKELASEERYAHQHRVDALPWTSSLPVDIRAQQDQRTFWSRAGYWERHCNRFFGQYSMRPNTDQTENT